MSVHVFLPCRKGSERVPRKNIMPFGGHEHGLISIKLAQLLACPSIDEVVLSTNDPDILDFASTIRDGRLRLHQRDESLSLSSTSTDELVHHAVSLIPQGDILWTHVTSPFVNADIYQQVLARYHQVLAEGFDSLMTTSKIHGFLWNDQGPLNYDRSQEKWPRTQTIAAVHEINSAVFLANADIYRSEADRIGRRPYFYPLDKIVSFDIDWPEDFALAQAIVRDGIAKI